MKRFLDPAAAAQTRNWVFIVLFNGLWALGNPFVNISTTLAAFFTGMQAPPYVFGLLTTLSHIPVLIQMLPRFCSLGSGSPRVPIYAAYSFTGVGYILYGALAMASTANPGLFVPLMLVTYFLISCSSQLAMILYLNYLTMLFPASHLGRVYGVVGVAQAAAAILGGFVVLPLVLNGFAFPNNYGLLFGLAGLIFLASVQFSLFTKPQFAPQSHRPCRSLPAYLHRVRQVLGRPGVRPFCLLMILIQLGFTAYGFVWPMLRQQGVESGTGLLRTLTLVAYCSQAVLMPVFGWLADKVNRKAAIGAYMACVAVVNGLLVAGAPGNYIVIYVVYGMYNLFISMCTVRVSSETVASEDRFDAIIIANVAGVMAGAAASVVYGLIATLTGSYTPVFIATAFFALLAIPAALRRGVNSPGPAPLPEKQLEDPA